MGKRDLQTRFSRAMMRAWDRPPTGRKEGTMEGTLMDLDLQLFEGGAAGDGGAAGAVTGGQGQVAAGNGQNAKLATSRQEKRDPLDGLLQDNSQAEDAAGNPGRQEEIDQQQIDAEWEDAKRGRFKSQFGRDVQRAVADRFKNQKDLQGELDQMQPMLRAMARKYRVDPGDIEALSNAVMDDDSVYEEFALEHGMSTEAAKDYMALQDEHDAAERDRQNAQIDQMIREHLAGLRQQEAELRQIYPNFNLDAEMQDERFQSMLQPGTKWTVEDAYHAVHHRELGPQAMATGVQIAQKRMANSMAMNQARPVEGGLRSRGGVTLTVDPNSLTRDQMRALRERVRRGEKVYLDR